MKKLFILFGLLSVLLCSCASKPTVSSTKVGTDTEIDKSDVDFVFSDYYWTTENYVLKHTDEWDYERLFERFGICDKYVAGLTKCFEYKFKELINKPEISGEDFLLLSRIDNEMYSNNALDYYLVSQWFKSLLKNVEIKNNTFTVKFTNTTDEIFHLKIHTNSPWRWYAVDINPHEEKYFTLPDMEENTFISFQDDKYKLFTYVGFESCACDEGYEYSKYLFSNYSLDFTFNPNNIKRKKSSGDTYYYDWKLVPRYEKEDNIIKHYMDRSNQVLPTNTENLGK